MQGYCPGFLLPDGVMASHRKALGLGLLTWEGKYLGWTLTLERTKPTDIHSGTNEPVRLKAGRVGRVSGRKHNCYFYYGWKKLRPKVKRDDQAKVLGIINRERVK